MSKLKGSVNRIWRGGEDGWTFIETIVVIAIVLILTSSVSFIAFRYLEKAKLVAAKSQIETLSLALESYYLDCGRYPTLEQGLLSLWQRPTIEPIPTRWEGPYLSKRIPLDPWGNPYEYIVPGRSGLPYGIKSLGADGKAGGEGYDADIQSWED